MPVLSDPGVGVSFIIPVHNGAHWLEACLAGVYAQADGRPMEIIVIDDGSTDGSLDILEAHAAQGRVTLVHGQGRGAAAASNLGIGLAVHEVVCQVDQDVMLEGGWMRRLLGELERPDVAAAQGYYAADPASSLLARVMAYDLELRYSAITERYMDHVCTGNTAYLAQALKRVGPFDETMGYGYDNDMSYRLGEAGYKLAFCKEARAIHRWRDGLLGYLKQQYGVGYGRLDLVAKHRGERVKGDDVSGLRMILHAPAMLGALVAPALGPVGVILSGGILLTLTADRAVAGAQALLRFGDPACLAFPPVHLMRDLAWAAALLVWGGRKLLGKPGEPRDSMLR